MRTLITADHVLAFDGTSHTELRDGAVLVEGDLIAYVGPRSEAPRDADETVELGESLLMPGLIDLDALTDVDHLILDSWSTAEEARRLQWSADYFDRRRHVFSEQERRRICEIGLVQLALHGITSYMPIASEVHSAWAESAEDFLAMAEFSRTIGLRGFLGPSYRSGVNVVRDGARDVLFDEAEGVTGLAEAIRFHDTVRDWGDDLLTPVFLPCRIETLTPELLSATAQAARERGALVRLHALQGEFERDWIIRTYGVTPLELIEREGLLDDRLIVPHGVFLDVNPRVWGEDRGDLATLVDAGVSIVHCPLTNARYGSELETFARYRDAGLNISLGTDSFPPDLIRGIDTGVSVAKVQNRSLAAGDLAGYIEAATLGGARALHRPDLGRIAEGASADLTAFRISDVRFGPIEDPVRNLVLAGSARDACLTMVAGRAVMRDGRIEGVDLQAIKDDSQRIFEKMRAAYDERDFIGGDALFPPVFPAVV
ncbi:chlorohydrolase family protein [Microbacterium capsulatum]|uniref:Chlorohydrolase family protein n=1 Tax=Microbacterium capsulatum TaxID=3041921 RepID=A0ABU0XBH6_9MICO|nr:chlorohydrolase family protein [Microbacterium sp. ASV81]MDQ4212413.1 chlorohydrolase family protein [Microbacterium sp. ASV81]